MKFARYSITALIGAVLTGCASTSEVLSKDPAEIFYSKDSVNTVAFCLADKNHSPALDRDDGSKVVLLKNNYGAVSMAFTIFPHEGGSRIELRKQFGTIGNIWKQCVGLK